MNQQYKITQAQHTWLQQELAYLQTIRQREVAQMIEEALSYGDPENNAEYDAALLEKQRLEERIAEYQKILSCARIVPEDSSQTPE